MKIEQLIKQAIDYLQSLQVPVDKSTLPNAGNVSDHVKHPFERDHIETIAGLKLPKDRGADQVKHIIHLLHDYASNVEDRKPLSIAIFGPPGSGKSTFVRSISSSVKGIHLVRTANMTQVNNSEELVEFFRNTLLSMRGNTDIPVIFFDEFDTIREGTPLGWLSWFLAPMEDGVMLANGQEIEIGKAVFIFAGGTAETLNTFSQRAKQNPEVYRARKVPDFISRLRGAIDIGGINEHGAGRIIRRTMALSYSMNKGEAETLDQNGRLRSILENGFFVHGVRSLKMFLRAEQTEGGASQLPDVIRRQHFSRGEFDGLTVGISAGLEEDGSQELAVALTGRLLQSGATLAYAGSFFPEGTLDAILKRADNSPSDLINEQGSRPRIVNYLGYPAYLAQRSPDADNFACIELDTISAEELKKLGAPRDGFFEAISRDPKNYDQAKHAAWAISQFRLRLRIMQDIGVLVVCGGKDDGNSWGRMSGIAEEVMIALALGKPVYVLGGADGAAASVGKLLGLHDAPVAIDRLLNSELAPALDDLLAKHKIDFTIPGVVDSPVDIKNMQRFLFNRGISTKNWPRNGLNIDENRALFASDLATGVDHAVNLIFSGLSGLVWRNN